MGCEGLKSDHKKTVYVMMGIQGSRKSDAGFKYQDEVHGFLIAQIMFPQEIKGKKIRNGYIDKIFEKMEIYYIYVVNWKNEGNMYHTTSLERLISKLFG